MRTLRIAALIEAASLTALLVNLLTWHVREITALGGPTHGMAYLVVIATTWPMAKSSPPGARWRALVPGLGGLLVLRHIGDDRFPAHHPDTEPVRKG
ncbi:DUF3817 domain-containing protein [Streptomyces sp. NPDC053079]|uniref:DUF3817 domain-containing protein n=1 Tax=Streptomyces sp. NPDC053079 TaxID=3365697 RepID=UPI0037D7D555